MTNLKIKNDPKRAMLLHNAQRYDDNYQQHGVPYDH